MLLAKRVASKLLVPFGVRTFPQFIRLVRTRRCSLKLLWADVKYNRMVKRFRANSTAIFAKPQSNIDALPLLGVDLSEVPLNLLCMNPVSNAITTFIIQNERWLPGIGRVPLGRFEQWTTGILERQVNSQNDTDHRVGWEPYRCKELIWLAIDSSGSRSRNVEYFKDYGIKWNDSLSIPTSCPMEMALRVMNWLLTADLLGLLVTDDKQWSPGFRCVVVDHADSIFLNLEYLQPRSGNHLFANIVALIYCGQALRASEFGERILQFGRESLDHEIQRQFNDDGTHHEAAAGYHRMVCELAAWGVLVGEQDGWRLSAASRDKLCKARDYLTEAITADGELLRFGDDDSSEIHLLTDPSNNSLAGLGQRTVSLMNHALRNGASETQLPSRRLNWFPGAGVALARNDNSELLCTIGTRFVPDRYIHRHNDMLSFEFTVEGQPIIYDPGTYLYSPTTITRNRMRSSSSHACLVVDGQEPCELTDDPFVINGYRGGVMLRTEIAGEEMHISAKMPLRTREGRRVWHRRDWKWCTQSNRLFVTDVVTGVGQCMLTWAFPVLCDRSEVAVSTDPDQNSACGQLGNGTAWELACLNSDVSLSVEPHPYSPRYGVLTEKAAVHGSLGCRLPATVKWVIRPLESSSTGHKP